jgi:GxxExxY protein
MNGEERDTLADALVVVPPNIEALSRRVIGLAIDVHKELGAGLPEEAYELAMCIALRDVGLRFRQQHCIQVEFRGTVVARVRLDLLVEDRLVVEIKSVESLSPIHRSQTMRYLKILNLPLGLLINFNVAAVKDGIKRVIQHTS